MASSEPSTSTAPSSAPAPTAAKTAKSAKGRPNESPDVRHSKTLSYILRHGASKESLVLRADGFVRVSQLMARPKLKELDLPTLQRIVDENEKKRFTIQSESTGPSGEEELWIRANQGHSVAVEDLALVQVKKPEDLQVMVHGTYAKFWEPISKQGLKTMTRNHLHCAVGLTGDKAVISGMRSNCDLFIYLNVPLLFSDNIDIFTSSNGVVLTSGIDGVVAPKYFEKVVKKSKDGSFQAVETSAST